MHITIADDKNFLYRKTFLL